jgi:hypothetical protein
MKVFGYLFVVLVLSTVAANAGQAPQGQAPKNRAPSASSKTTHGGQATQGQFPKNGGLPSASGKAGRQEPGGGKGSSAINGTEIRR